MIPATGTLDGASIAVGNHLWQSTLFIGAAWLLTLALKKNHSSIRHSIWFAASLKFLLPFSLLVALGRHLEWSGGSGIAQPRLSALENFSLPFARFDTSVLAPTTPSTSAASATTAIYSVVSGGWLVGFAAVVLYRFVRSRRVRALAAQAKPLTEGREIEAMRRVQSQRCSHVRVGLASSPSAIEPGVRGIVHPVLLLPSGIADRLSDQQLAAVLAHELSHVQRRDNMTAALHMMVETVFWFHPLVWWIGSRLVDERERACDEDVLQFDHEPQVYAGAILKVCEFYLASPMTYVSGVTGSNLKKRIEAIMINNGTIKLNFARKTLIAVAALASISLPILLGSIEAGTVAPMPPSLMPIKGPSAMTSTAPLRQPPAEIPPQPPVRSQASASLKTQARDSLNKGVSAFRAANYQSAIEYFKQAVSLDPDFTTADIYLGTAYAQQFVPGDRSRENLEAADHAIESFKRALIKEPDNVNAVLGVAAIYQNTNDFQNSREAYLRATRLVPRNPVPFYSIGALDWIIVYDKQHPQSAPEQERFIVEGLENLNNALALDPQYDDAMTYMNLLLREKARLAIDPAEKTSLTAMADGWFNRALETRKQNRSTGRVPAQDSRALAGPPPPPPPPAADAGPP